VLIAGVPVPRATESSGGIEAGERQSMRQTGEPVWAGDEPTPESDKVRVAAL